MAFKWPEGFERCPDEDWATQSLEELALKYDTVEEHGWYDNLIPTVNQVTAEIRDGDLLVDYSGGTGIFCDRLFSSSNNKDFGLVIADSSPKFLRLSLEKFRNHPQVGFRLIRYLRDERRLEWLPEVLGETAGRGGVDGIISTNAIHLYYRLEETLTAWRQALRPNGRIYVQSGNIGNPNAADQSWIIDDTVAHIDAAARELVREDDVYGAYRSVLTDSAFMEQHDALRKKYFLPVRPLSHYLKAFEGAGLIVDSHVSQVVHAKVDEWFSFLSVYHEGVLGWFGGAEKITGVKAPPATIEARKMLIRKAMDRVFGGLPSFEASWTYIRAHSPARP